MQITSIGAVDPLLRRGLAKPVSDLERATARHVNDRLLSPVNPRRCFNTDSIQPPSQQYLSTYCKSRKIQLCPFFGHSLPRPSSGCFAQQAAKISLD
jgi:hypothetical protein